MKTLRPCLAEFLGTFYLCFAGIGAILCGTPTVGAAPGLLGIALAHGLALSIDGRRRRCCDDRAGVSVNAAV